MDFFISTKQRTDKEELMDDFSIGGDLLRDTLDKLEKILAEISAGELIDKITILEIKKVKISDSEKLENVEKELSSLNITFKQFIPNNSKP